MLKLQYARAGQKEVKLRLIRRLSCGVYLKAEDYLPSSSPDGNTHSSRLCRMQAPHRECGSSSLGPSHLTLRVRQRSRKDQISLVVGKSYATESRINSGLNHAYRTGSFDSVD